MRAWFARFAALSLLAAPAHGQCPVAPGVWAGQVGQQRVAFRIASDGTMVDSVAVSLVDACGQHQYSATDVTPVQALQCNPWGFDWEHCRDQSPSTRGFRVIVRFDGTTHGFASLNFLGFACGSSCPVADMIDVTLLIPYVPPAISCHYDGEGTIEYGVADGGSGALFEVETAVFGPISLDAPPRDLTGPEDSASFPVSCTGAGRTAVTLSVRSGAVLTDVCSLCFECAGAGQTPAGVPCRFGGPSQSTQWTQTYIGPDRFGAATVRQTADGGYALAGHRNSGFDLIKTDPLGNVEWEQNYTVAGRVLELGDMEPTEDGYVLVGSIREPPSLANRDFYLLKADTAGDMVWTRTYGDSLHQAANAVALTSDGGYMVVGDIRYDAPPNLDFMLMKTDASGTAVWTRFHDAGYVDSPRDVQETSDGGFILAGYTEALYGSPMDSYLVKTDAVGIVEWERTFGGIHDDWAHSVQQTSDGGFVLAGGTEGVSSPAYAPEYDFYMVRTTANGTELWSRSFGGPDREVATAVREAANGGYLLVGSSNIWGEGIYSAYVVSTMVSGEAIWTLNVEDSGLDVDVALANDGGAAVLTPVQVGSDSGFLLLKLEPPNPNTTEVPAGAPRPAGIALSAFPNPFNPTTTLVFMGAEAAVSSLTIHDAAGRLVQVLARGSRIPGGHMWTFDASGLPSGIYTASLKTDRGDASRKLVLVK